MNRKIMLGLCLVMLTILFATAVSAATINDPPTDYERGVYEFYEFFGDGNFPDAEAQALGYVEESDKLTFEFRRNSLTGIWSGHSYQQYRSCAGNNKNNLDCSSFNTKIERIYPGDDTKITKRRDLNAAPGDCWFGETWQDGFCVRVDPIDSSDYGDYQLEFPTPDGFGPIWHSWWSWYIPLAMPRGDCDPAWWPAGDYCTAVNTIPQTTRVLGVAGPVGTLQVITEEEQFDGVGDDIFRFDKMRIQGAPGILSLDQCTNYSIDYLRAYCLEPLDGGLPDTTPIPSDPDPCANRGTTACATPHAIVNTSNQTQNFEVSVGDNTTFFVNISAISALTSGGAADIMYVLDRSGSMNNTDTTSGDPRIQVATDALNSVYSFFKIYDDSTPERSIKLGLESFNHDDQINNYLTYVDDIVDPSIFFNQPKACGCTGIGEGVNDSIGQNFLPGVGAGGTNLSCQSGDVQKVVVIASDGIENRIRFLNEVYADGDIPDDITFYTIGIGAEADWALQLRSIAENWGTGLGFYTDIATVDDLENVYLDIAKIYTETVTANRVTVKLNISPEFEYLADTSGVTPTVRDNFVVWELPRLLNGQQINFNVTVEPRAGTSGGLYSVINESNSEVILHNNCGEVYNLSKVYTNVTEPLCGNGRIDPGEACDDGNNFTDDLCTNSCQWNDCPFCSLESVNFSYIESTGNACVDEGELVLINATLVPGSDCSAATHIQVDANSTGCVINFNGADLEGIFNSSLNILPTDTEIHTTFTLPAISLQCLGETVTGNKSRLWNNTPDVGAMVSNAVNATGSLNFCGATCGDGILTPIFEQCDDNNTIGGDGCSSTCTIEAICTTTSCGDGFIQLGEQCDVGIPGTINCDPVTCQLSVATCSDGVQNGDETGVDCGGSCPACVVPPSVCTGSAPSDATICSGDDLGLSSNTPISLVDSCGSNKCEYTCDTGFIKSGNSCVPSGVWAYELGCLSSSPASCLSGATQCPGNVNPTGSGQRCELGTFCYEDVGSPTKFECVEGLWVPFLGTLGDMSCQDLCQFTDPLLNSRMEPGTNLYCKNAGGGTAFEPDFEWTPGTHYCKNSAGGQGRTHECYCGI